MFEQFIPDVQFILEYSKSATDNRYSRSMVEWNHIAKYAEEHTVNQARKKYYGITPDGKTKIYLSLYQIKKKKDEMKGFEEQHLEHYKKFTLLEDILSQIVSEDPELYAEYEKMSREYDYNNNKKQYQQENEKKYTYAYYKIIHYDHDLYEKQKEE
jgi:hypothetical protein